MFVSIYSKLCISIIENRKHTYIIIVSKKCDFDFKNYELTFSSYLLNIIYS